ncbi:MAG: FKBP-type peptidyl-prolyl cis-trans isomerase [Candidatus Ancillula sp.]|jgi:peptidylprolyl isomerase|nr:FKBP-type peptidyl-prolyl cis-trans isomerase [Candidatus Ancillula sp.]
MAALDNVIVEGSFGDDPKNLEFTEAQGPDGLEIKVLKEGEGKETKSLASKIYCNYHGQLWNGKVFDSSFARRQPIGFGLNQVIKGWGDALVGKKEGSRVLISVPPELGYGAQTAAMFGSVAPLVFVVDILYVAN